ncbi:MAG: hypothetical protein WBZ29_12730 [Methanocella sp.]
MKDDPKEKWINYFTVAGLAVFVILGIVYLNLDTISQMNINFSLDPSSSNLSLPGLPNINFDWFTMMDPVSKIIFSFLVLILGGSLIGSAWLLIARKRASSRK